MDPPWQFFLKPLTPPREFGKIFKYPPPWIFNLCASMSSRMKSLPKLLRSSTMSEWTGVGAGEDVEEVELGLTRPPDCRLVLVLELVL